MVVIAIWLIIGGVAAVFLLTALIGAPYVPTHKAQARLAFSSLRKVTADDVVLDIGSGDGVVLQQALELGAGKAIGYEINPFLVGFSRWRLRHYKKRAQIQLKNFWDQPFPPEVTIVYTFGESRDITKMYQRVVVEAERLQKQIDFISYAFRVPNVTVSQQEEAVFLYRITPLQAKKT